MERELVILVVDDDPNDIALLQRAFRRSEITNPVHASSSGEDALAYLQGSGEYEDRARFPFPSVLITDLKMPLLDGFEILKWLRAHPECRLIPVIVFSASGLAEDVKRAYDLGANAFLHKPATLEELERMVRVTFDFWDICQRPPLPEQCKEAE